jgi:polyphosphate kinase 2 (PPK2 family)
LLENVNLKRKIPDEEYARVVPGMQRRLYDLEKACWDLGIPSAIVFEGWDAAGKGSMIATVTQRLDPRGFKMHAINLPRQAEQNYPWMRRFWLCVPDAGEMAIFDQSWYTRLLTERVEGLVPEKIWRSAAADIVDFERALADNGTVMLKFFLHISKREQEKRFLKIESDPLEAWRVTKAEWARHKRYEEYLAATEEMLESTDSYEAPWTIVEATSRRWARTKVLSTIITALEQRLGSAAPAPETSELAAAEDADLRSAMDTLETGGEAHDA